MQVLAVPLKRLERAKRRLGPLLTKEERATLALAMLDDVLGACFAQIGWDVWVVSSARAALELAERRGARAIPERTPSLLAAVHQAEAELANTQEGAEEPVAGSVPARHGLAVLLADLPLITAQALSVALSMPGPVVAAAAESDGGTNLLVRRPGSVIQARFGRSSFAKHRAEANRAGLTFQEVHSPELGFDLDRPADLSRILRSERDSRTRTVCLEMGLVERLHVAAPG